MQDLILLMPSLVSGKRFHYLPLSKRIWSVAFSQLITVTVGLCHGCDCCNRIRIRKKGYSLDSLRKFLAGCKAFELGNHLV